MQPASSGVPTAGSVGAPAVAAWTSSSAASPPPCSSGSLSASPSLQRTACINIFLNKQGQPRGIPQRNSQKRDLVCTEEEGMQTRQQLQGRA